MLDLFSNLNPVATGIVVTIFSILILTIILTFVIRRKYTSLIHDLESPENRVNGVFAEKVLNKMVDDYHKAVENNVDEINTPVIIEKHMAHSFKGYATMERIASRSVSLMVILGLLGTFYGLTLSIGEIVTLLASTKGSLVNDMTPIIDGLMSSLQGMSVAFVTSLCGIGGSIIVTLINMAFSIQATKEQVFVYAEEYLDHYAGRKRGVVGTAAVVDLGLDQFGDKLEENLKEMTSALNYRLGAVATEMANTAESLNGSIGQFDASIQTFSENTRDFSEFNHDLRSNIQRMNVSFDDFSTNIKSSTKELKNGHQVLSNTLEVIGQERTK